MLVGVVSDTHGRMHHGTLSALAGVERILHAGDVGDPAILHVLSTVAPVTAVRGNVDHGELARVLPETEVVELDGVSIYVLHDRAALDLDPVAAGFGVVVSGHTHKSRIERYRDVLYLNPGSCGPRRFRLPITIAKLSVERGDTHAEIVTLET
ncbi:MAG TPA: metallophosphoesterase family protein [Candidatus Polarisedimenticolaceae bacterium]|nr:metallophosphoesterase family protein [Candidatus Polarisedimenticolaceae bacterium]